MNSCDMCRIRAAKFDGVMVDGKSINVCSDCMHEIKSKA